MKEIILITGASGEIGENLIQQLYLQHNIVALDINEPRNKDCIYEYINGSILDQSILDELNLKYNIKEIYHLAAILSTKCESSPDLAESVNIYGTLNLFNLCLQQSLRQKKKIKFFFPSSIAVYDLTNQKEFYNIHEIMYCNPKTVYGKHKLFCENLGVALDQIGNENKIAIDFRSIRFPGIISVNTLPTGGTSDYAPEMIYNAYKNKQYECFVNKQSQIPFIVMPDAINAIIQLMNYSKTNLTQHVYNITSFNPTVEDLFHKIKLFYPDFELTYKVNQNRQNIIDSWPCSLDDSLARTDWNWRPQYDFTSAFEKYIIPQIGQSYE